jgi:ParB/RepB/Spo0J family partition protein
MPLELKEIGVTVPLSRIIEKGSAQKVRRETADQGLDELLKSIKTHGQIHAISLLDRGEGKYEVVNGHRRHSAAQRGDLPALRANIYMVPAGQEDDEELLIQQHLYAANMAEPLVPVERARMFDLLMRDFNFDVQRVAEVFEGESPETVTDTLKFLSIDETVLDIIAANPGKFTEAHLRVLADYASPATKHAWRMKPDEQVKIAREIVDQVDKQVVKDPRKLEARIKSVVNERRAAERKKKEVVRKAQADPVKALFRAVEQVEAAVKSLKDLDLQMIKEIDAADKGAAIKRLYDAVESITVFSDDRVAKLPIRVKAAS